MGFDIVLDLFKNLFMSIGLFWEWFTMPFFTIGNITLSPIMLFSVGGIFTFISIAVVMWAIK